MRSQGVADTQLGEPGWHRRAKLSPAGSAMPLLTLCEPGFSTRVGVPKPVGASVAACCATATAVAILASHTVRTDDHIFQR